jgi:hypothetical protein
MSIFGLEETPIGPVVRGYELKKKHGRTFDRWEAHYVNYQTHSSGAPFSTKQIALIVVPVKEDPPKEKMFAGRIWYRSTFDVARKKVFYRSMK